MAATTADTINPSTMRFVILSHFGVSMTIFVSSHGFLTASAFRPASVIRTRAASTVLLADGDALGARGGEPGADKLDHLLKAQAVRDHERLGKAAPLPALKPLERVKGSEPSSSAWKAQGMSARPMSEWTNSSFVPVLSWLRKSCSSTHSDHRLNLVAIDLRC